jgi:hypothetical protein
MNKFKTALCWFAAIAAALGLAMAAQARQVPKTLALADFNGNGEDEAVAVIDNMSNGLGVVVDTGTLGLAGAQFLSTSPGALIDAGVLEAQAAARRDGVAFLLQQDRPMIEAYDPQTGRIFRRVRLPAGHDAVSLDTSDTLACVLTEWTTSTGKIRPRLFIINMLDKTQISKPALSQNFTGLNAVIGGENNEYCLVLVSRKSDGKGSVQVWDLLNGVKVNSIPIPNGQDPTDHAAVDSLSIEGVATLALRQSDGRGRVIVNDLMTSTTLAAYALPDGHEPVRVIFYNSLSDFAAWVAVLANRTSDNTPVVTILDPGDGSVARTIEYTSGNVGNDVSFHPASLDGLAFTRNDYLAVTTDTGVVEIRDGVNGELIGSLGGG